MPLFIRQRIRMVLAALERRFHFDSVYLARGSAWLNGRVVFATVLTFGLSVALANLLTPEQYGNYKFIISAVTFWGAFLLAGANTAVVRAVAQGAQRTFLASIPLQIRWDVFGAVGIAATGAYYITRGNTAIGLPILLAALLYPIGSVLNTYSAYFGGMKDFRRQAIYESLTTTLYVVSILAGLLAGAGAGLLAVLFFLSNALGHSVGFFRAKRMLDPDTPIDHGALSYARQLTLVSIPASLMLQLDNILVFHYLGSAGLAIYTFAMLGPDKIASLLKFMPVIALPKYAQRTTEMLRNSVPLRALQFSAVSGLIGIVYALAAPLLFRTFFPRYLAAVPYTRLYALSLLTAGVMLATSSLMAQARIRRIAAIQFVGPVFQLVMTFIGIRYLGLWGAIGAKLAGDFMGYALTLSLHQYRRPAPLP